MSPNISAFELVWKRHYPGANPVGYMLRTSRVPHWVRFHSLPQSKRYPDNEEQWETLLARQNTLADEILGEGEPCWLAQSCWETPEGVTEAAYARDPFWACHEYGLTFCFRFIDGSQSEEIVWNVHAKQTAWRSRGFDQLLRVVADDQVAPTLWLSEATGCVLAPYDGGVDLFLPSLSMLQHLKAKYAAWLSSHPEGL